MLKLYDYPASQNGWKARALLALLKQPYETVWVPIFGKPEAAFLELNPLGKVPVLELEDGRAIPESHAILCYLAEGTPYLSEDRFERAEADGEAVRDREARLELVVIQVLQLQRVGEHDIVALEPVRAVDQLARVQLQQLAEQVAPERLRCGQLHHPHPEDHDRGRVMHHDFGAVGVAGEPDVRLQLRNRQAARVEAVQLALHVFPRDH